MSGFPAQKLFMLPLSLAVFNNVWECFGEAFLKDTQATFDDSLMDDIEYSIVVAIGWAVMGGKGDVATKLNEVYRRLQAVRCVLCTAVDCSLHPGLSSDPLCSAVPLPQERLQLDNLCPTNSQRKVLNNKYVRNTWERKGGEGNVRPATGFLRVLGAC